MSDESEIGETDQEGVSGKIPGSGDLMVTASRSKNQHLQHNSVPTTLELLPHVTEPEGESHLQ